MKNETLENVNYIFELEQLNCSLWCAGDVLSITLPKYFVLCTSTMNQLISVYGVPYVTNALGGGAELNFELNLKDYTSYMSDLERIYDSIGVDLL